MGVGLRIRFRGFKQSGMQKTMGFSFVLTNDYPADILVENQTRVIGKKGSEAIYSISTKGFSQETASQIRQRIIDSGLAKGRCMNPVAEYRKLGVMQYYNEDMSLYIAVHETLGFGPFSMLLEDSQNIEEIMVNNPLANMLVYHSKLGLCKTNIKFASESSLRFMVNQLIANSSKELSDRAPIIDAYIDGDSRLHAQMHPYSLNGTSVSIRSNRSADMGIERLMAEGTINYEIAAYLWQAIETGANIVIAGAPASGKTSLLIALLSLIPRYSRTIIIEEDTKEISLGPNFINSVHLGTSHRNNVDLKAQIINALHIRPDRIVVGELRGSEAREVFSAGNLGISFITTMHSNTNGEALIDRLLCSPMSVEEGSLHALDVAIFMEKRGDKRVVSRICEYNWVVKGDADIENVDHRRYSVSDIATNAQISIDALANSKVLRKYSEMNMISQRKALLEHKRMAKFLSNKKEDAADAQFSDYIQSYVF